jgi:hypothetical protein
VRIEVWDWKRKREGSRRMRGMRTVRGEKEAYSGITSHMPGFEMRA